MKTVDSTGGAVCSEEMESDFSDAEWEDREVVQREMAQSSQA